VIKDRIGIKVSRLAKRGRLLSFHYFERRTICPQSFAVGFVEPKLEPVPAEFPLFVGDSPGILLLRMQLD
jgi:hypothetical protein